MTLEDKEFTTKVFTSDDHSLKILGELLSNQVSRDIIRLLIEKEMYANEIANKLGIQFNLLSHHLKKMGELGLLSVSEKRIVKKGQMHKYYKINPGILLLPNYTKDKIEDKGILEKIFKDGIRFASIGIVSFVIWSYLKLIESTTKVQLQGGDKEQIEILDPLVIALTVIIIGLCGEIIYLKIKKG